jgi:hypothetical protein
MKVRLTSLLVTVMLALGLTLASAAPAASPEPHPSIRRAIGALEAAKHDLEHAAHDFGGHRVEAIEAINHALEQLHKALEYDK